MAYVFCSSWSCSWIQQVATFFLLMAALQQHKWSQWAIVCTARYLSLKIPLIPGTMGGGGASSFKMCNCGRPLWVHANPKDWLSSFIVVIAETFNNEVKNYIQGSWAECSRTSAGEWLPSWVIACAACCQVVWFCRSVFYMILWRDQKRGSVVLSGGT